MPGASGTPRPEAAPAGMPGDSRARGGGQPRVSMQEMQEVMRDVRPILGWESEIVGHDPSDDAPILVPLGLAAPQQHFYRIPAAPRHVHVNKWGS